MPGKYTTHPVGNTVATWAAFLMSREVVSGVAEGEAGEDEVIAVEEESTEQTIAFSRAIME